MADIIRVENLVKTYGKVQAVRGVSFGIPEGVCFGLLGPNGAGKTTSIEMMEGITEPTSGNILFRGKAIDRRFRERVGIQFQNTALPEFITVRETLELFSAFYTHPRPLNEIVELCSLADILDRDNRKLSGGQRQRLLLGIAVIPRPEVLFLDEPTTGLDPQARRNFWELIRRVRSEGATVVLTTHYMDEAEILCDQIAIMDHGQILEIDTPRQLLAKHFTGALLSVKRTEQALDYGQVYGDIEIQDEHWVLQSDQVGKTLRGLLEQEVDLDGLSIHKPNLEDLFIKLTGSSLRT